MARVTATEVKDIFDTTLTDTIVDIHILSANILVDKLLVDIAVPIITDATHLKEIERWLSAHFAAIQDPRAKTEKADVVGQTIESKVDLNLNVTRYGQQVLILDTSGAFADLQEDALTGGGINASMTAVRSRITK